MLVRRDMLIMPLEMWRKFENLYGKSSKMVDLSIIELYNKVGLISSKTAYTNEDENLFMHYLYRYARAKRKKL